MIKIWKNHQMRFQHTLMIGILFLIFFLGNYYVQNYGNTVAIDKDPALTMETASPNIVNNYLDLIHDVNKISEINGSRTEYYLLHVERINLTINENNIELNIIYLNTFLWNSYFGNETNNILVSQMYDIRSMVSNAISLSNEGRVIHANNISFSYEIPQDLRNFYENVLFLRLNTLSEYDINENITWRVVFNLFFDSSLTASSSRKIQNQVEHLHNDVSKIAAQYGQIMDMTFSPLLKSQLHLDNFLSETLDGIFRSVYLIILGFDFLGYLILNRNIGDITEEYNLLYIRGFSHEQLVKSFLKWSGLWIVVPALISSIMGKLYLNQFLFPSFFQFLLLLILFKLFISSYIIMRSFRLFKSKQISNNKSHVSLTQHASKDILPKIAGLVLIVLIINGLMKLHNTTQDIWYKLANFRNSDIIVLIFLFLISYYLINWSFPGKIEFIDLKKSLDEKYFRKFLPFIFISLVFLGHITMLLVFVEIRKMIEGDSFYNTQIPHIFPFNRYYLILPFGSLLIIIQVLVLIYGDKEYTETMRILKIRYLGQNNVNTSKFFALRIAGLIVISLLIGTLAGITRGYHLWEEYPLITIYTTSDLFIQFLTFNGLLVLTSFVFSYIISIQLNKTKTQEYRYLI